MGGWGGKRVSRSSHIYTPFLNFRAYFESRTIFENILSDIKYEVGLVLQNWRVLEG